MKKHAQLITVFDKGNPGDQVVMVTAYKQKDGRIVILRHEKLPFMPIIEGKEAEIDRRKK